MRVAVERGSPINLCSGTRIKRFFWIVSRLLFLTSLVCMYRMRPLSDVLFGGQIVMLCSDVIGAHLWAFSRKLKVAGVLNIKFCGSPYFILAMLSLPTDVAASGSPSDPLIAFNFKNSYSGSINSSCSDMFGSSLFLWLLSFWFNHSSCYCAGSLSAPQKEELASFSRRNLPDRNSQGASFCSCVFVSSFSTLLSPWFVSYDFLVLPRPFKICLLNSKMFQSVISTLAWVSQKMMMLFSHM